MIFNCNIKDLSQLPFNYVCIHLTKFIVCCYINKTSTDFMFCALHFIHIILFNFPNILHIIIYNFQMRGNIRCRVIPKVTQLVDSGAWIESQVYLLLKFALNPSLYFPTTYIMLSFRIRVALKGISQRPCPPGVLTIVTVYTQIAQDWGNAI